MASYLTRIGHDIAIDIIDNSEVIFVCVPSYAVVDALSKVQKEITNQKIIICSKGFAGEGKLISEVLNEKLKNNLFFFYGPILAEELRNGEFSSMVLAGGNGKDVLKKEIESESLYIETSDDIIGIEISAALKNVVAIFIGIVEGAGYGQNAGAFIFAKGVQEIRKIGLVLGAQADTFLGLSCIGDLTLLSRNRRLGIELGKGRKLEDVTIEMKYNPEGIFALKNAKIMIERLNIDAPLIKLLYKIVFENYPIKDILKEIK